KKRKLNSYEQKQADAKRIKQEKMMLMMDERHGRDFKPEFNQVRYFRDQKDASNKGKKRADLEPPTELGRGVTLSIQKKPFGTMFRTLTFERRCSSVEIDNNEPVEKLYTLVYIYRDSNDKHMVVVHTVDERELKISTEYGNFMRSMDSKIYHAKLDDSKATLKCELENITDYQIFIKSFVVLYGMSNTLRFDSEGNEKALVETIAQLAGDYSNKLSEIPNTRGKQPYQIIEFLAENPPLGIDSQFDFKIDENETIKIESINDLVKAAAIKNSQNKMGDQAAMPPPPRPIRRVSRPMPPIQSPKSQVGQLQQQPLPNPQQIPIQNIASPIQMQNPQIQQIQQMVLQIPNHQIQNPQSQQMVLQFSPTAQIQNHLIPQQMAQFPSNRPPIPANSQVQMAPKPQLPVKRPRRKNSKQMDAANQPESPSQSGQFHPHPQMMMQIPGEQNQSSNQSSVPSPAQTPVQIGMPGQHSAPGTPLLISGQNQQSDISHNQLQGTPMQMQEQMQIQPPQLSTPNTPIQITMKTQAQQSNPGTPTQIPTYIQVQGDSNSVAGPSASVPIQIQGIQGHPSVPRPISIPQQPKNGIQIHAAPAPKENQTQTNNQATQINSGQVMIGQIGNNQTVMTPMQYAQLQSQIANRLSNQLLNRRLINMNVPNMQNIRVQQPLLDPLQQPQFQINPQMQLEIQDPSQIQQIQQIQMQQMLQQIQGRQGIIARPNIMVPQQRIIDNSPRQMVNNQWVYHPSHPGQQPQ
ncbi:8584_t:CDS:2, partial [Acaulospora morrowiae]